MPPATRKATHKPSFFGGGAIGLFGRALDAEPDPGGLDLEVGSKGRAFFKISGGPVLPQAFGGVTGAFGGSQELLGGSQNLPLKFLPPKLPLPKIPPSFFLFLISNHGPLGYRGF